MKSILVILTVLFVSVSIHAQNVSMQKGYTLPAVVVDGDTMAIVRISNVYIFPPLKFRNHEEYLEYRRIVRDVKKVYPYAMIARKTMIEIHLALDTIEDSRKQKKYMKQREAELLSAYKEELKDLTIRQGKILIKLVDREMDQTSYELIKELRGGAQAAMWQGVARLFGETLKAEYNPTGEDLLIERVVIMYEQGTL